MISGDHERTALDFQKHYRQTSVYLMDTDVSLQAAYSRGGWPFLMLVDPNGTIVRKVNNMVDGDPKILKALQRMKASPDAAPIKIVDGRVFLVFTSWRGQSSDVWLRVWDGKTWSEDRATAASDADEYDGAVVAAPDNKVWFCWTSNAGADKYNIFATSLDGVLPASEPSPFFRATPAAFWWNRYPCPV